MATSSSSFSSAISVGTAEIRPLSPSKPLVTNIAGSAKTSRSTAELLEQHRLPSPPRLPDLSPLSPISQDTMHHLRRPPEVNEKRKSIIDPSTVRLSFVGSITDLSQPMAMPLELGFQKLYKLYEQSTPTAAPLPHEVQITEIPLDTIAEHLETHIEEQNNALQDCAENIQKLNSTNDKTRQELVSLEFQYCLARQEANMRAMTANDTRLRLEWMRNEIARINTEKESALRESSVQKEANDRLRKELADMQDARQENQRLKHANLVQEQKQRHLQHELAKVKRRLDDTQFALRSVPSPIQKLCARMLVPEKDRLLVEEQTTSFKDKEDDGEGETEKGSDH
ncbi:hypothetical protein LTR70_005738 [Exophiala xenobiotica]|uniref:Uncharacterized protein n=1 Tax=Lithohypha guttulata TaxID=1690604 RepID=A0ABR0K8W5_9EURO|nr:hypothetical protein LTR24_005475 [Lithohypha guttulata]KAK5317632.1 hypothetical protein LTR70_005738 [Exophiala xenobiotica]